jgi:hypothetical protein
MRKATKVWMLLLAGAMLVGWSAPALGQAVSDARRAQNKLLAYRAARADGIRKLAERINGLFITSETTVKDFVAESDTINTAMRAFLTGVREKGKPKWMEDGTCEVVMEVTIQQVVVALKQMCTSYYKGDKFKVAQFDQMTVTNKTKVLRETGMGAPRPDLAEEALVPVGEAGLASMTNLRGAAKAYWMARCTGRGRLMAVRAARLDGLRRLSERIYGLMITSETSVRDFVAESDEIETAMAAFIRGARERGIRYHADELIVEVEMEVTLRQLLVNLKTWRTKYYKGDKVKVRDFEQLIVKAKDTKVRETGMGVPPEKYLVAGKVTVVERAVMVLGAKAPGWVSDTMRGVGRAAVNTENPNKAQAKLMAFRAAELDARRKLAEQVDGLMITSRTSVRNFVAENDEIKTAMLTFQQGGSVVKGSQKLLPDGTAEATVEIDLKPLWNVILYYQKKLSITIR